MRYEDASSSFSSQGGGAPDARDDADALAAGSRGPATGNTITGAGTITGTAGADVVTNGPGQIVALEGAGGTDTAEGGSLSVQGRFGDLTMDSRGTYSYTPHAAKPDGGSDVFRYTLADRDGARDTATLTIDIGREIEEIEANAQQIIPGPDGVVTLPPGVELSDILVVGRNLVINMPDGTQMVIVDGAVFVPQLVLGGVEVPASNLAALLIDFEPQPAAGTPMSSGGNFAIPLSPLDPGVPLGDLLPPTELAFTPPTFEEVGQFVDREPEIFIQPDGQPAAVNAVDSVDERGLGPRGSEPPGSGEIADGIAGNNSDTSERTTGTIVINSPDTPNVVTINGVVVTSVGQTIAGTYGSLTITSISSTAIGYSYAITDNTSGDTTADNFTISVRDNDGDVATATLTVNILDDVPTARPDTDSIAAGTFGPATGNVITDSAPGDAGDGDNGADTVGADNATVTAVSGAGGSDSTFSEGVLTVNGQYGVLTIDAQGNYSYVRNPDSAGGVTDTFNYTITDGDGDTSTSTLTISIADRLVTVGANATVRTDDDAVPGAGGNPGGIGDDVDAENLSGTLSGSGGDGPLTYDLLTTGAPAGFTYVDGPNGSVLVQQGGVTVLTITVNASTGAYTVTQNAPIDHPAGGDENNLQFTITYTVTDVDGDSASGTLVINVDDDTPTIGRVDVSAPTLTVDETDLATNATGNFSTLFSVSYGADGAGTTSYSVSVVNGTDSGLDDVATGQDILLFNNGGVVEGRVGSAAGPVAFTVSVNSATGVITLDQIRALEHPDASNPDDSVSPTATSIQLTVTATDGDGDPVSQTINIGGNLAFEDDGPTAVDDSATQTTENAPITVNVIANDAQGADGVSNSSISYVDGTLSGSGTLVYNGDGTFTYTPSAGEEGTVTFQYQIVDADGDPSIATVTLTLAPDSVPIVTNAVAAVDDDGLAGGNPASTTGDLDANAGEPGATPSEAVYVGTFTADFGSDTPGTFSLAGMHGATATVGTETVTYSWDASTNTLTATGPRGVLFTVAVNPTTGQYTVTLVDNVLHTTGNNENDATAVLTFTATDSEGDTTPGTLTITFDDDAPTAVDDSATQTTENAPVTVNVIANDAQGADGVSNSSISYVDGTLSGSGTLVYNNDGTFTYTPSAGETGTVTFQYQIVDADGDPSIATVTITLQPDSVPIVTNAVAAVDDDGLACGNPLSTAGDLDANAGEPGATPSEAIYVGTFSANFGGDTGTFSLAGMHGTTATVGTELVTYSWDAGTNTLTATGPRGVLFTVAVNPTSGQYTVTLVDNVLHAAGNNENDATAVLTFTATDSDGDSQNGTLTITFDDDMPSNFTPVDLIDETGATATTQDDALVNNGTVVATRLLNDANNDGVGEGFIGADGFGDLVFSGGTDGDPLLNGSGTALTADGDPIYLFGYGTGVLTATTDPTNADATQIVFTVTLNEGAGCGENSTYTIDFNREIDDGGGFVFDDFSTAPAGQNLWIGLDSDGNKINVDNNNSEDLLITGIPDSATVNTSATDIGANNQWIDEGEGIRLDFVIDVRTDGTQNEKDNTGYTFDSHYNVTDAGFTVMQTQGGGDASVHIRAVLDSDAGDIKTLSGTTVPIDEDSITVTGDSDGLWEIIAVGDGTFIITGLSAGAHVEFETVEDPVTGDNLFFNAVEISSAVGMTNPETGAIITGADFSLGEFGFTSETAGNPVDFSLDVTASDADGDTATGTIDIVLVPDDGTTTTSTSSTMMISQESLEDTSTFSLTSSDSLDQQRTMSAANNNSVLLGAIAAAGLGVSSAAAAQDFAPSGNDATVELMSTGDGESFSVTNNIETDSSVANGFAGETREAVEQSQGGSPADHSANGAEHSLTAGDEAQGQQAASLPEGTEMQQSDPAQSTLTSAAVGMPSAEMLAGNANGHALDGQAQGTAEVGRVLADALAGGGDGPTIDAVLDAVANPGGSGNAALDALASHGAAAVSAWHMAGLAGLPGGHSAATMDPMLHHDAVQISAA